MAGLTLIFTLNLDMWILKPMMDYPCICIRLFCLFLYYFWKRWASQDYNFFSSPESKAQVSFSDQNLSIVRCHRCRHRHCCQNFSHFHLLLQNQLGPISTKLGTNHLGWREFKFVQMKGSALFQGKIIAKMHWQILKIFFSRTTGTISIKLGTKHSWMRGNQGFIYK